ncbi:hypothetical protein BaRGS_00023504 [Batillaria attramentaria]|uniref:DUF547 domain-containing protein n=1 Tax=Batillaria attramentaria TaxID=370345 RepID=A0ABD0KDU2_9CAEN
MSQAMSDREKGVERGQRLLDKHYIRPVPLSPEVFLDSSSSLYRLLEDFESTALNAGDVGEREDTEEAAKLGEAVRKQMLRLYGTFLSEDGKKVDYQAMKGSAEFEAYAEKTKELQRTHIVDSSREVKLAFFINIYNALVIHGNVIRGSPRNDWQRYKFFNGVKYIIGGYEYSLQDIENGVLRANRKGVGMLWPPFSKNDPRLKRVMQQLKVAAESFLSGPDGCTVDVDKHTVHLSRILKWYRVDFGKDDQETAQWVYDNMAESETKQQLGDLINSKNFKVAYMKYDWSVNAK